jgi:hypothetical protein
VKEDGDMRSEMGKDGTRKQLGMPDTEQKDVLVLNFFLLGGESSTTDSMLASASLPARYLAAVGWSTVS